MAKDKNSNNSEGFWKWVLKGALKVGGTIFTAVIIGGVKELYDCRRKKKNLEYHQKLADIDVKKAQDMKDIRNQDTNKTTNSQDSDEASTNDAPYVSKLVPLKDTLEKDQTERRWLIGNKIEEGGRCIVFGPPGIGKSIFALQCALAIAEGSKYKFLPQEEQNQHDGQQVIHIDLEMVPEDIIKRTRGVTIPDNILRNTEPINNFDELFWLIEHESQAPKVTVIIDNLRKFEEDMSQTNRVTEYFNKLEETRKNLANKGIKVTFITITHTDKKFDIHKPVQMKDVAGGADLSRFSTSVYALVPGRDSTVVFKAIKQRCSARMDGVYILRIEENPNLHLEYVRTCKEEEALPIRTITSKSTSTGEKPKMKGNTKITNEQVIELVEKGLEEKQIASKLEVSCRTVQRHMKEIGLK